VRHAVGILDSLTADLGLEDDQSAEYGVRHCQQMSIILKRLINDGNLIFFEIVAYIYKIRVLLYFNCHSGQTLQRVV